MKESAALAAVLIAASLPGQYRPPKRDPDILRTTLQSDEAKDVAWAAHDARLLRDESLGTTLVRALHTWRTGTGENATPVVLQLLDALIELQVEVPAADLVPLLEDARLGTAAFALLARSPRHNEAELLRVFRTTWHAVPGALDQMRLCDEARLRAIAAGNLLAAQRTPGFAALLLADLDLDLHVLVGSPSWSVGIEEPPDHDDPDGFPAPPQFRLRVQSPTKAWARLSRGPMDIALQRHVDPIRKARFRRSVLPMMDFLDTESCDGMPWLCQLAGDVPLPRRRLTMEQPTDFVATVEAARVALRTGLTRLREALVANGTLTEDEAKALQHEPRVVITDLRNGAGDPLPELPKSR